MHGLSSKLNQMIDAKVVVKRFSELLEVPTAHNIGHKKVLVSSSETDTPITQIAYTSLDSEDFVEAHIHPTMDEHFVVLTGSCKFLCDEDSFTVEKDSYVYVPAGVKHSIKVINKVILLTIGVAK